MKKTNLLALFFLFIFSGVYGQQRPDSVQVNGEWYFVYPVNEKIQFNYIYYTYFDLQEENYPIWLEWKIANDPRANLKKKELDKAIHRERYQRKEISDSIRQEYVSLPIHSVSFRRNRYKKSDLRKHHELAYGEVKAEFPVLPPVVAPLPDGKYIQYFEPAVSIAKRKKAEVIDSVIACFFELKDNDLNGTFLRMDVNGDTLCSGTIKNGFQQGSWLVTVKKSARPMYRSRYLSTVNETVRRSYNDGVENGETRYYSHGLLSKIENFKNGEKYGLVTELSRRDSIVYDYRTVYDLEFAGMLPNSLDLYKLIIRSYLSSGRLGDYADYGRFNREMIRYFAIAIPDEKGKTATRQNPLFQTTYKIYDRQTKALVFYRVIDTVSNKVLGWSKRINGQLLDTVYYSYDNGFLVHDIYDTDGKVIWHSGAYVNDARKLSETPVVMIDGFETNASYIRGLRKNGYELIGKPEVDGKVYYNMTWDRKKQLIEYNYFDKRTAERVEGIYLGAAEIRSTTANKKTIVQYTDPRLTIQMRFDSLGNNIAREIVVDGKPFSGEVELKKAKQRFIKLKNDKKLIVGASSYYNSYEYLNEELTSVPVSSTAFFELFSEALISVKGMETDYEVVKGNVTNGAFNGNVQYKNKKAAFTLNYTNGKPSGNGTVYEKNFDIPNSVVDSLGNKLFSISWKDQKYRAAYTLLDGQLHGEMQLFNTKNEQFASVNYAHGELNGPFWAYWDSDKLEGQFKDGKLIGHYSAYKRYAPEPELVSDLELDSTGNLIHGKYYNRSYYDREDFTNVSELRIMMHETKPFSDQLFETKIYVDDLLTISHIHNITHVVESRFYVNGILSSSNKYGLPYFAVLPAMNNWRTLNREIDQEEFELFYYGENLINFTPWNFNLDPLIREQGFYRNDEDREYYFKKFYTTGLVAREGQFSLHMLHDEYMANYKTGLWKYYDYEGNKFREIDFSDSTAVINGVEFNSKGRVTDFDKEGNVVANRILVEEIEHYECSSDDYYAERQYVTLNSRDPKVMNGIVRNYYDNGALMSEGKVVNGIPEGLWKFFAQDGKLSRLGSYVSGQKNGKWLNGDLSEKAYIGDVCIDPDDPAYEVLLHNLETDKEIKVQVYKMGILMNSKVY